MGIASDIVRANIQKQREKAEKEFKLASIQTVAEKKVEQLEGLPIDQKIKDFARQNLETIIDIKNPDLALSQLKSTNSFIRDIMQKQISERDPTAQSIKNFQGVLKEATLQNDTVTIAFAERRIQELSGGTPIARKIIDSAKPEKIGQAAQPGTVSTPDIQTEIPKTFSGGRKPKPGDIVPKDFNVFGIPTGFEIFKASQASEKDAKETEVLAGGIANLISDFNDAIKQRDAFAEAGGIFRGGIAESVESVTLAKLPKGTQQIISGRSAGLAADFGADDLNKVQSFNLRRKAFATRVAKAAGEQRPTDVDIERFLATLPAMDLPDATNADLIQGLVDDINARSLSPADLKMLKIFFGADPSTIKFEKSDFPSRNIKSVKKVS